MNEEMFEKHRLELEKMIRSFFESHPGILKPDEGFEITVIPTKRFIAKIGQIDLDKLLDLDIGKIIPKDWPVYSVKIERTLRNYGKLKIRDVVQMTRGEFLRCNYIGMRCLAVLEEWLSKYDERLSLGMKL